jgi:hypothetical protein
MSHEAGLSAPATPGAPGTCVPVTVVPPDSSGGQGAAVNLVYLASVKAPLP